VDSLNHYRVTYFLTYQNSTKLAHLDNGNYEDGGPDIEEVGIQPLQQFRQASFGVDEIPHLLPLINKVGVINSLKLILKSIAAYQLGSGAITALIISQLFRVGTTRERHSASFGRLQVSCRGIEVDVHIPVIRLVDAAAFPFGLHPVDERLK
jgi:hypothetical protein